MSFLSRCRDLPRTFSEAAFGSHRQIYTAAASCYVQRMPAASDLEALYDAHAQGLFGFLLNLTRNEEDTRDLLQDLLLKLGRNPALLKGMRDERAYLLRLAHNAAIDLFRRRMARKLNSSHSQIS